MQALLVLLLAGWIDYSMPYLVLMSCLRYNSAIVRLMGVGALLELWRVCWGDERLKVLVRARR